MGKSCLLANSSPIKLAYSDLFPYSMCVYTNLIQVKICPGRSLASISQQVKIQAPRVSSITGSASLRSRRRSWRSVCLRSSCGHDFTRARANPWTTNPHIQGESDLDTTAWARFDRCSISFFLKRRSKNCLYLQRTEGNWLVITVGIIGLGPYKSQ